MNTALNKLGFKTLGMNILGMALLTSAVAAQASASPVALKMQDSAKDYLVAGIALHDANAPFMTNSLGYQVTLQMLKGSNACTASQKQITLSGQDAHNAKTTELNLEAVDLNTEGCREKYEPVFGEVKSYIPTWSDYFLSLDTNTQEIGVVSLLGNTNGAVVSDVQVSKLQPVVGLKGWTQAQFEVVVQSGTNSCDAANNVLAGYVYTLNGQVHLAVKKESANSTVMCPMMYAPVSQKITFAGIFETNSKNTLVIENFGEKGVTKVQRFK